MHLIPCTLKTAMAYCNATHRHHPKEVGGLFAVACGTDDICGVAIIGRPKARMLQDGYTCEIARLATDGSPNACSMLYGAARRAAKALGYTRIITYILATEPGTSLRASGWVQDIASNGGEWDRPSRSRQAALMPGPKVRWICVF